MNKFIWQATSYIYNKLGPKRAWEVAMGPIPQFVFKNIVKFYGQKVIIVRTKYNFLIRLTLQEYLTCGYLHLGETNPRETKILRKIIEDGDVIFDVGSYIGWYSLNSSQLVGKKGKVFAFEPNPKIAKELKVNCNMNNFKNINICEIALSDQDESTDFWIGCNGMLGSLKKKNKVDFPDEKKIKVKSVRIDTFCKEKEIKDIKLIKIDAEGSDLEVIKGGKKTLTKLSPFLIVEVYGLGCEDQNRKYKDIIEYLSTLGYQSYEFTNDKLRKLPLNKTSQLINLFFAKDERRLKELNILD